ncbi:MAG: delta-60 repeat domain-containing protein, partial [Candidatus Dormibacteraceae bacterium]
GPDNAVYFISPQPEGTLLLGGDFTSVNGTNINRIARLHADGSLDSSFLPRGGVVGGPVYHVLRQANGRIVFGGGFNDVDGVPVNRLARLMDDGSLDTQFNPGAGANDMVLSLALQPDGRVLAGGLFATYDGTSVGMVARVYGDPVSPLVAVRSTGSALLAVSWPAWASAYALEETGTLNPEIWQRVTNAPTLQDTQMMVTLPLAAASQFFRLISP